MTEEVGIDKCDPAVLPDNLVSFSPYMYMYTEYFMTRKRLSTWVYFFHVIK